MSLYTTQASPNEPTPSKTAIASSNCKAPSQNWFGDASVQIQCSKTDPPTLGIMFCFEHAETMTVSWKTPWKCAVWVTWKIASGGCKG